MLRYQNNVYFNPGCALSLYKPEKVYQILSWLRQSIPGVQLHEICCRHEPKLPQNSVIINVCAGCDRRFRSLYPGISTVSLWEIIDQSDNFPFPDYSGARMSVHDACPVRNNPAVHKAVRSLLEKMHIHVEEAQRHGARSVCCGDSLYPECDMQRVHAAMKERASQMPCDDVVVYCVSCIKAMDVGGKTPRHLVDLLLNEATIPQKCTVAQWHEQLDAYIAEH